MNENSLTSWKKMALMVGVPAALFIHKILNTEKGPTHTIKNYVAYCYLRHLKKKGKHRLESLYDIYSNNPIQFGILIPSLERILEFPRLDLNLEVDDNILIFGVNSQKEHLIVRISQTSANYTTVWVNLRLSNRKSYTYEANDRYLKVPKTGEDTFAAGGLRVRCLTPMRRWRVSYNGLLRESTGTTDQKGGKYIYVKFSFIWATSSTTVDFTEDIPECVLSNYLALQKWKSWLPDIHSLKECLDSYEQSGMLFGTVSIDGGEEVEVYLWGGRKRSMELADKVEESLDFFGCLKEGDYFHVSRLYLPNSKSSLDCGFIMMPTGFVHAMDNFELVVPDTHEKDGKVLLTGASIIFKRDKVAYNIHVGVPEKTVKFGATNVHFAPVVMNDDEGEVMILHTTRDSCPLPKPLGTKRSTQTPVTHKNSLFVAKITELTAGDIHIAGGKGASLGELSDLSTKVNFTVPKGVLLTTKAYEHFISYVEFEMEILLLQNSAWKHEGDVKDCCERTVTSLGSKDLPMDIQSALEHELLEIFHDSFQSTKFAVRSSAVGEDSDDMSAAGQMETFLGVRGLPEIMKAIVKCWASQFSYTAIQYKRQNGQLLNTPMAVVVQEMVPVQNTAGVTFTCDPVTGNPSVITITANYGIGESVVSASAEPDTILLDRNERDQLTLRSVQIGKKATKVILSESSGIQEVENTREQSKQCCIDSEMSLLLAQIALEVEKHFAIPMDIEWAIKDSHVYLLQARPVTTHDSVSDFEISHAHDSSLPSEYDYTTTANVGEVILGGMSPLGTIISTSLFLVSFIKKWADRNIVLFKFNPYMQKGIIMYQNHAFFDVFDNIFRFHKNDGSIVTDAQMISLFGRVLKDPKMIEGAMKRNKKDTSKSFSLQIIFYIIGDFLFIERRLQKSIKSIKDRKIDLQGCNGAQQTFYTIVHELFLTHEYILRHAECSFASSMYNLAIMSTLRSAKGEWHEDVYTDFASLVSNCPQVESADVPCALQELATALSNSIEPSIFQKMEYQDVLRWIQTTQMDTEAGQLFAKFIEKHGHRCVNEVDIYSKPWNSDATPVIASLQEMVRTKRNIEQKKEPSITQLLDNLKVQLGWKNRLFFRFVLPYCRQAVGQRERSKSVFIKCLDIVRNAFRTLEVKMVEEGRLPDGELLYFMTLTEIDDLLRTRSPRLLQMAFRRRKMFKEVGDMIFPEIMRGIPRPVDTKSKENVDYNSSLIMKGTPVSKGIARGIARVAKNLKEAAEIKPGEILIAYGTDIGWSPYFPIINGVATELGGLISHGAVVAREYGLPCVVGVHGATQQFQTGDLVLLDGNKGILERIDQQHDQPNSTASNL